MDRRRTGNRRRWSRISAWLLASVCPHRYPADGLVIYRSFLCMALITWWLSFLSDAHLWFGSTGILTRTAAAAMLEYEEIPRWQSWSPLWWTDDLWAYYAWIAAGVASLVGVAIGWGGRLAVGAALVLVIGWANRIAWLGGPVEPAAVSLLGFLLIAQGDSWRALRRGDASGQGTGGIFDALALKAARVHTWLLLAAGLASQLAGIVWWRGEAVWWLAASGHSWTLSMPRLFGHPLWINALTHGMILLQILSLWMLAGRTTGRLGMALGGVYLAGVALLADHALYALLLAAGLASYWTRGIDPE